MVGVSYRAAGYVALLSIALYNYVLRGVLVKVGVGRVLQPITDFPYQCRRISHAGMEACEDMWFDETNRQLYLACSNVVGRRSWMPNVGSLNESAAPMDDSIYVLDVDKPVGDSFRIRKVVSTGFHGTSGESNLHLLSVSGRKIPKSSNIELYLINNKPSLDNRSESSGVRADNAQTGANATVELFELKPGSSSMRHIRTFHHPLITTPNNVAPIPDGSGFYIANDHGPYKTGIQHTLSPWIKSGNVVHCTNPQLDSAAQPVCKIVATSLSFPNGLTIHPLDPKTLYVPSTMFGKGVSIFKIHADGHLTKLTELEVPYPIDNLSPGGDGSIYAAAFPKVLETLKHFDEDATFSPSIAASDRKSVPATVLKISKVRNLVNDGKEVTWAWEKVLEDQQGQVLPTSTIAIKDDKTGRLFISGQ